MFYFFFIFRLAMQDKMQPPTGSKDQTMEADQNGSRQRHKTSLKGKRQTASGNQNNVFFLQNLSKRFECITDSTQYLLFSEKRSNPLRGFYWNRFKHKKRQNFQPPTA